MPDLGTLAPGQAADIARFDQAEFRFPGSGDPVAALVLCGARRVVDGELPNIDLVRLRARYQEMADTLASRAGGHRLQERLVGAARSGFSRDSLPFAVQVAVTILPVIHGLAEMLRHRSRNNAHRSQHAGHDEVGQETREW